MTDWPTFFDYMGLIPNLVIACAVIGSFVIAPRAVFAWKKQMLENANWDEKPYDPSAENAATPEEALEETPEEKSAETPKPVD